MEGELISFFFRPQLRTDFFKYRQMQWIFNKKHGRIHKPFSHVFTCDTTSTASDHPFAFLL